MISYMRNAFLKPGDLVSWKEPSFNPGSWRHGLKIGLVISTQPLETKPPRSLGESYIIPEATIRWNTGEETKTNEIVLVKISGKEKIK